MPSTMYLLALLTLLIPHALAHDNGMDMSMDGAMSLDGGHMMVPYLHFTPGDTVFFYGWVPRSTGAIIGTCIGLFMLAILERWVAAVRAMGESVWSRRAQIALANKLNAEASKGGEPVRQGTSPLLGALSLRSLPPFMPAQDIFRGMLHAVQAALGFLFMLAVMTFQVGFILSIVVGSGVGEMLFGRYAMGAGVMAH